MITTEKFVRKPFYIDAVQITEENMADVAKWCGGEVHDVPETDKHGSSTFIRVKVQHPMTDRQTRGMVGDWVLYANKGYKVYTEKAFGRNFESVYKEVGYISDEGVNTDRAKKAIYKEEMYNAAKPGPPKFRDAGTGEYVTEDYAEHNQSTTVSESGKTAGEINEDRGVTPA